MILGVANVVGPTTYYNPSTMDSVIMVLTAVFFLIGAFILSYRNGFPAVSGIVIGAAIGLAVITPVMCVTLASNFFGVGTAESVSYADGVSTVHVVNTETGMDETVSIQDDLRSLEGTEVVASNLGKGDNVEPFDADNPKEAPADVRMATLFSVISFCFFLLSLGFTAYSVCQTTDEEKLEIASRSEHKQKRASVTDERNEFDRELKTLVQRRENILSERGSRSWERRVLRLSADDDLGVAISILSSRSGDFSRSELVKYGDKMRKLNFLLGENYYGEIRSNPKAWDDPHGRVRMLGLIISDFSESLKERDRALAESLSVEADAVIDSIRSGL